MDLSNLITKVYAAADNTVVPLVPSVGSAVNSSAGLEGYLKNIFPLLIQLGVAIAILSMTYWGLRIIISNVPGFQAEGKERMMAALLGLGILLIAYLILNTINPQILKMTISSLGGN